jgi:hypothetical protein
VRGNAVLAGDVNSADLFAIPVRIIGGNGVISSVRYPSKPGE